MEEKKTPSEFRVTMSQMIPALIKNLLLIGIGMSNAYPAILIPSLSSNPLFDISKEEISWIASINLITVVVGGCFAGILTQKIGRKRFMQILCIPVLTSWIILRFATAIWQIFLALSLQGISQGLIEAPAMAYVAEITQPRTRGMLITINASSVVFGIFIEFTLGTFLSWRNAAAVSCVMPSLAFLLLFFIPESPYWLVMRNKHCEAQESLAWLRGWTTIEMVDREFRETYDLKSSIEPKRNFIFQNFKNYTKRNFYWPFTLMMCVGAVSVFVGLWSLQTYAVNIYITFAVPIEQYYSTFYFGIVQCAGCFINIGLVPYLGKRILSLFSLGGVAIINCAIGVYGYLNHINYVIFSENEIRALQTNSNWLILVLLLLLSFIGNCGIRSLPWTLIGEVFTHETRATGCGLTSAVLYCFGFIANKTFLDLTDLLTLPGIFWFYCGVSVIGMILIYFILPETEGKSLQEIIDHFSGVSKLGNRVKRKS